MGANWDGPFDLASIGQDDTLTAIFMAGRQALHLIASHLSGYDFFFGCQTAGLSVSIINSPEEAYEDRHFKERGFEVDLFERDTPPPEGSPDEAFFGWQRRRAPRFELLAVVKGR